MLFSFLYMPKKTAFWFYYLVSTILYHSAGFFILFLGIMFPLLSSGCVNRKMIYYINQAVMGHYRCHEGCGCKMLHPQRHYDTYHRFRKLISSRRECAIKRVGVGPCDNNIGTHKEEWGVQVESERGDGSLRCHTSPITRDS